MYIYMSTCSKILKENIQLKAFQNFTDDRTNFILPTTLYHFPTQDHSHFSTDEIHVIPYHPLVKTPPNCLPSIHPPPQYAFPLYIHPQFSLYESTHTPPLPLNGIDFSPIMTSSIRSHCPSFTFPGLSKVETISPPVTRAKRSTPSKSACSMAMIPASANSCSG